MKSILLLAPKMDGPGGHPYNTCWPGAVDQSVEKNRWKVVTPSLLLLATIAMQEGFDVTVVDEDFLPLPKRAFDLVCMYTVTPTARRAYRYAEAYRAGGTYVALGGVHTSHMQRESALYAAEKRGWSVVDCACGGEPLPPGSITAELLRLIQPDRKDSSTLCSK